MKTIRFYFDIDGRQVIFGNMTEKQFERISLILIEDAKIVRRKPRDAKGRFIKNETH